MLLNNWDLGGKRKWEEKFHTYLKKTTWQQIPDLKLPPFQCSAIVPSMSNTQHHTTVIHGANLPFHVLGYCSSHDIAQGILSHPEKAAFSARKDAFDWEIWISLSDFGLPNKMWNPKADLNEPKPLSKMDFN